MAVFVILPQHNANLHYAYALFILSYSGLTICISTFTPHPGSPTVRDQRVRRGSIVSLMIAVLVTYVAELLTASLITQRSLDQHRIAYLVSCITAWSGEILFVIKTKLPVWYVCCGSWLGGIVAEVVLIPVSGIFNPSQISFSAMLASSRLAILLLLPLLYFTKPYNQIGDNECQPLCEADSTNHGTIAVDYASDVLSMESDDSALGKQQRAKELIHERLKNGTWWTYIKGYAVFFPYIWPVDNRILQLNLVLVMLCVLFACTLNLLIPLQLGKIVKYTTNKDFVSAQIELCIYIVFRTFAALLRPLIAKLWQTIGQYCYTNLNTSLYAHAMSLSNNYHDSNDSSEIYYSLMDANRIINLMKTVCLEVVPQLVDLVVALVYLSCSFGPYMILVILFTIAAFFCTTIKIMAWQALPRRRSIKTYRKQWYTAIYGLQNWAMALAFGNIDYEVQKYKRNVENHLKAEKDSGSYTRGQEVVQSLIFQLGLSAAGFIAINQIRQGTKSASDLIVLITYWLQLTENITFFSQTGQDVFEKFIYAELTLGLIRTKPSVTDADDANPLELRERTVKFEGVTFVYPTREKTLENISFVASQGTTTAIVGTTGGGKTTMMKLLQRLYDPDCGSISIGDQDIRYITTQSLHNAISTVPQEPPVLKCSVLENIRYAKLGASDKEVEEACKAASLHDEILKLPKGYKTIVGGDGVKLSGGQKQRLAIARVFLRNSSILILDEATNSLDTETEGGILDRFNALRKGHTTFIIAHHLSTTRGADQTLVIEAGKIIERGTHEQLMALGGKYCSLWSKQHEA